MCIEPRVWRLLGLGGWAMVDLVGKKGGGPVDLPGVSSRPPPTSMGESSILRFARVRGGFRERGEVGRTGG
jgi:hypothetical protein